MKSYNRKINEWMSEYPIKGEQIIHWIDSRRGHRKARWLKILNRAMDYYQKYVW